MNGLIGIQWREVCVNLPIILSNVQAVGTHIVTEKKTKKVYEYQMGKELGDQRLWPYRNQSDVIYPKA